MSDANNVEIEDPTAQEAASFEEFRQSLQPDESGEVSMDIPFGFTVGAATVVGVFQLRDPIENSSAKGAVAGVINGTFRLDKNRTKAKLYDPTGNLVRMVIELNFAKSFLRARIDTRKWDGRWSKGSWVYFRF